MTPICPGSRTATNARGADATCPVCRRVQRTHPSGRLWTHFPPARCAALAYQRGNGGPAWPGDCSRNAAEGSRYCWQHGGARP